MMLFCIYSNDIRLLKQFLVNTLKQNPLRDPFLAEQIVVPGMGLSQWLKLELATALGVAAHMEYPMPANFLWRLFHNVLDEVPKDSDFHKEVLVWHIYAVLPGLLAEPAFQPLKQYLEQGQQQGSALFAYQLAAKIADVFDQYLVYRIDWINDWSAGGAKAAEQQPWQPLLWRAVCARIQDLGREPLHRARLFSEFIEKLKKSPQESLAVAQLPSRLFFFGFSSLPPLYLAVLEQLAAYRDVYLLVTNPCRHFWSYTDFSVSSQLERSTQSENTHSPTAPDHLLLRSLGKQAHGFLSQLQDLHMEERAFYLDPPGDTLLSKVQQDMLEGFDCSALSMSADHSQHKASVKKDDFSLSFHSHYSPLREVEGLHDHLLFLFESDAALTAGDIVVMVPDIDRYSPYIHAVFSHARKMPFSVADRSLANEEPLLKVLLSLLQLPGSRLGASEVLELLEQPALRRRFQLDEAEGVLLSQWIKNSGIRWALHAEHRREFNLPAFEENTWSFGLKRMLAGYSMGEQQVFDGIASFDEVGGLSAALVGKLATLLERLEHWRSMLAQDHTVDTWVALVHGLLEDFLHLDAGDELFLQVLWQNLERFSQNSQLADYRQALPHAVFIDFIKKALAEPNSAQPFLTGQISFCTLLPKRALPFKVVCLLGMNEADYPAQQLPLGFDLMSQDYRLGDRSRRDEERYLFLEALLAADNILYVSWLGRNNQDNSEKQASLLVNELLEYCQNNYCLLGDEGLSPEQSGIHLQNFLVTQHPLHAFSAENFSHNPEQPLIFSYARQWLLEKKPRAERKPFFTEDSGLSTEQTAETVISLEDFLRFFKNPCAYFMRRHLQVDLSIDNEEHEDHEPFQLDGLQAYQLKRDIVNHQVLKGGGKDFDRYLLASGQLPASHAGKFLLEDARQKMEPLALALQSLRRNTPVKRTEIDFSYESSRLLGWIKRDYAGQHVAVCVNEPKAKDYLSTWLHHVLLCAVAAPDFEASCLLGLNKNSNAVFKRSFKKIEQEHAKYYLNELLAIYLRGCKKPLPFFPQSAWVFYNSLQKEHEDQAFAKASQHFYGNSSDSAFSEASDPNVSRIFPSLEDVRHAFMPLAKTIYTPLFAHLDEGGGR